MLVWTSEWMTWYEVKNRWVLEDRKTAPFIYQFSTQDKTKIKFTIPLLFPERWLESPTQHHNAIPSLVYAPGVVPGWYLIYQQKDRGMNHKRACEYSTIITRMKKHKVDKNNNLVTSSLGGVRWWNRRCPKKGKIGDTWNRWRYNPNIVFIQAMEYGLYIPNSSLGMN